MSSPLSLVQRIAAPRIAAQLGVWLLLAGAVGGAAYLAHEANERSGYSALTDTSWLQMELYAAGLDGELARHEPLPSIMELDVSLLTLLTAEPADPDIRERANKHLVNLGVRAGAQTIFAMNRHGVVMASSDWFTPDSGIGENLAHTPYFQEALLNGHARWFTASPVRFGLEFYFARAIHQEGRVIGVAAVKVSLESVESQWTALAAGTQSHKLLVVDENDVVIMTSTPAWKFKTLGALPPARRQQLAALGRYPVRDFQPLGMSVHQVLEHGSQLVHLPLPALGDEDPEDLYLWQDRVLPRAGWRVVTLSGATPVRRNARNAALGVAGIAGLFIAVGHYLRRRRRELVNRLAAREALQRAHDELEHRVQARTAELYHANAALVSEVAERKRTEAELREAQGELVQSGKLAMLGQMSAGITHEINQPLTALCALSDNAVQLLQRGRLDDVARNLHSIAGLTERIGRITSQLKSFASKTPPLSQPVRLADPVTHTLAVLRGRIEADGVAVWLDLPPAASVRCDGHRLEQVLLNLCGNALDAMKGCEHRRLSLSARVQGGRVHVRVADTGSGISEDAMPHLFEPFFSTKSASGGLGLGLVISSSIVREFGGVLRAANTPDGSVFEFDLTREQGEGGDDGPT